MVLPGAQSMSAAWGAPQLLLLETAAREPGVERIFVNPGIKRAACQEARGDRSWLRKLRPWWGHDAHFHVRIRCPADSPECTTQKPIPEGDGCGADLAWWFSPAATSPKRKEGAPRPEPAAPAACIALLHDR
jgi:penicillin-insensitive murein endopeptidase